MADLFIRDLANRVDSSYLLQDSTNESQDETNLDDRLLELVDKHKDLQKCITPDGPGNGITTRAKVGSEGGSSPNPGSGPITRALHEGGTSPNPITRALHEGGFSPNPGGGMTTLALGEEGISPKPPESDPGNGMTTLALGEEGISPKPPEYPKPPVCPMPPTNPGGGPTTRAMNEGGSSPNPGGGITTLMMGEEGISPKPPESDPVSGTYIPVTDCPIYKSES